MFKEKKGLIHVGFFFFLGFHTKEKRGSFADPLDYWRYNLYQKKKKKLPIPNPKKKKV